MNMSKFLISSASALAVVGAIGFAVAQTTPMTSSDTSANTPASPMTNADSSQSTAAMPASPTTSTDGSQSMERVAQADRN